MLYDKAKREERISIKQRRSFNYSRQCNEEALIYRRVDETLAMIRPFGEGSNARERLLVLPPLIRVEHDYNRSILHV